MMFSIWEKETFFATQDVIVAGSGFTGLWSAYYLKKRQPNLRITIIDRSPAPTGASTRNAGFASFGSVGELVKDAQHFGTDAMLQLVAMRFKGLQKIKKHFGDKTIDFERCGGYELVEEDKVSADELQTNVDYLNSLLHPITDAKRTFRMADESLSSFGFGRAKHLMKNNLEGYLHPGKLLQALLQKVQSMGVTMLNGIEIKSFSEKENQVEIITNQPYNLSSSKLLICTNAFAKNLLPDLAIVPARGQVIVTSPIKNLPFKGAFHSDEGFYYFRNTGDRVLLGGGRHKAFADEATTDIQTSDFIQRDLESYLAKVVLPHYSDQYFIEHRWAGIMSFGEEKMPIIKQLSPQVFCAVGMGGIGVAMAPVAARQAASLMY